MIKRWRYLARSGVLDGAMILSGDTDFIRASEHEAAIATLTAERDEAKHTLGCQEYLWAQRERLAYEDGNARVAALTLKLAGAEADRDYHRAAAIQQSVYWRNHYADELAAAKALISEAIEHMQEADDDMCGQLQNGGIDWMDKARSFLAPPPSGQRHD